MATACSTGTPDSAPPPGGAGGTPAEIDLDSEQILLTAGLQTVDSCDSLLNRIKDDALARVGPYGFDQLRGEGVRLDEGAVVEDLTIPDEGEESADFATEQAEEAAVAETPATTGEALVDAPTAAPAAPNGVDDADGAAVAEGALAGDGAGRDAGTADQDAGGDVAADSAATAETDTAESNGEADTSGTNNQEQGVDEADLVKTDGERLVVVAENVLQVIDVTRPTPELIKSIELPDEVWGGELFLNGDHALLMSSGWTDVPLRATGDRQAGDAAIWPEGSPIGRLIDIDLNEGRVVRTLEFEGSYLSAREIDGSIRIVLAAPSNQLPFVYPSNDGAADAAEQANKALVETATIDQWLPSYRITEGAPTGLGGTTGNAVGVVDEGPIVECDRVHLPNEFAGFGSLVMLTATLDGGLQLSDSLSVFTDAQTVYASTDRVAVATQRWPLIQPDGQLAPDEDGGYQTAVHTFDITDPTEAGYVASGTVRGHLLNQYSLSEYGGYLRVATTAGSPWGEPMIDRDGAVTEAPTTESFVTVLSENGNVLTQTGQVGGLGVDEDIFAVRFIGDVGYVVTFRQVDPLYTVDLSDPSNPRVAGELKIPGFSSYLHPAEEGHLIGVGTDGDESGRTWGTAMSLFDVSDPANPTLDAKISLDQLSELGIEGNSYTPVSSDAKAFTYWDGTAIVPVAGWTYDEASGSESQHSEAVLVDVEVSGAGALTEVGRVSHPATSECEGRVVITDDVVPPARGGGSSDAEAGFVDPIEPVVPTTVPPIDGEDREAVDVVKPAPEYCYSWAPEIYRSVVIGDDLYTVSHAGVRVNRFDTLADIMWIPFG